MDDWDGDSETPLNSIFDHVFCSGPKENEKDGVWRLLQQEF